MEQDLFALSVAGLCAVAVLGWLWLPAGLVAAWLFGWLYWRRAELFLNGIKDYASSLGEQRFDAKFSREEKGSLAGVQLALESAAFDLKNASALEARRRDQVETALRGIQDGVLVVDDDGRVVFVNPSFRLFFQADLEERKELFYWELFREPEIAELLRKVLGQGGTSTRELTVYRGAERNLVMAATALPSQINDRPSGAIALFYDRTEQKRLEKMRSDFVANVSHELRTPLTAIKAALETLQEGALDDPKVNRSFLDKAVQHSARLNELIVDLLALAGIEEDQRLGRVDSSARADVASALGDARLTLESALDEAAAGLAIELPADLPALACDRAALRQVLLNLIENALKYSGDSPRIRVSAMADAHSIEVSVSDSGPGIPEGDQQRIFERFYRVDKARTRGAQGGSGLGLAIVKHLIENYGGSVGVENLDPRGCRFWFRLPKAAA